MVKEYIERDKTLQNMHGSHSTPIFIGHKTDEDIMFERMCGIVIEQPTADVVEVRHSKWNEDLIGFCNVCMECGLIIDRTCIKNNSGKLNLCPNCGAKMDLE